MKKTIIILILILTIFHLYTDESHIRFYGVFESITDFQHKREYEGDDYGEFSWGMNNYANLRFKAVINEYITFDMAVNINLLSGNYTNLYRLYYKNQALSSSIFYYINPETMEVIPSNKLVASTYYSIPFYYKNTYIGSFDLERLYFKGGNLYFDIQAGLMRFARGYGYIFKPLDFFNPHDPLNPNARPEGKLSLIATFYPLDMWKIETFVIAPDNPIEQTGWGFKIGAATLFNIDRFNFEFLYTLFLPEIEYEKDPEELNLPKYTNNDFSHIVGFSFKADIEIGLFFEILYRFDHKSFKTKSYYDEEFYLYKGLEASIGIDYTISIPQTHASIYLLMEYQFYGSGMIDWWENDLDDLYTASDWVKMDQNERKNYQNNDKKPLTFLRHDYLYGMIKFTINTYVGVGLSYLFGIDDQSSLLSWFADIEPLQAFTINITATYPLGWEIVNHDWNPGEFGSTNVGYYQDYKISVKMKF